MEETKPQPERAETPVDLLKRRLTSLQKSYAIMGQELAFLDRKREELKQAILKSEGAQRELGELVKVIANPTKPEAPKADLSLVEKPPMTGMIQNTPKKAKEKVKA